MAESPPEAEVVRGHLRQDGCTGSIVFVVYDTIKTALEAVTRLHARPLHQPEQPKKKQKGQQMEKGSQQVALPRLWARQVSGEGMHLKKWRLIIRNIPFTVRHLAFLAVDFAPAEAHLCCLAWSLRPVVLMIRSIPFAACALRPRQPLLWACAC